MLVGRVTSGNSSGQEPQLPPHLGNVADLAKLLHEQAIDRVLFFPPFETPEHAGPALVRCEAMGIPAGFSIALVHGAVTPAQVVSLFDLPFLSFDPSPKRPEALAIKHGLDVVAAATLLLLLVPLLTFIALAIRISMGRPIFFSQERAGLYGRRFRMFKFRTMDIDAEQRRSSLEALNEMGGPVFKATHDPRITRLGRLLRRLSLDELPQLFHVLLGTMSLVGPRPLPIAEQQNIRGWHRRRLSMKPGITGLWQVSGRNDVGFEEWMRLDLAYVDRWSLLEDFRILFKTIPTVLLGRGAR
jgi:exopolysaccharide biosynthesis polyprenyl glycosylphosphotransferase